MEGPKLSNFKIGRPIPQNDGNRRTKTAIKLKSIEVIIIFLTKINDIHSFKLIEYIDTMKIRQKQKG